MGKKEYKIHSIKYNFIMNVILKISGFIFPLVTFPYVTRVLGAGPNGKIGFAASVVSYFALLASLGIPSYGVRKCAEVRDNERELAKTVKELLIINSVCLIISYSLFVACVLFIQKFRENAILMFISSLTIVFSTFGVEWFYQAIEQYNYITVRNIIFKIVGILMMFVFVRKETDYIVYAGINVFATVGSNILNTIRLRKFVNIFNAGEIEIEIKKHLFPIFMLFSYNATTTIFTNLDQVMLGFMVNDTTVGYYNASIKMKNVLTSAITALGAVMLPRVSYYLKQGKKEEFEGLITKSFNFIFVSAIPISMFFILKSGPIITFIAGEQYGPSVDIMKYLAPAIVFIGASSVTAWQLLIPLGKEKYTVVGAIVGAITDLILNFLLIPIYAGVGAAVGTVVAEFGVLITHLFVLKNVIKKTLNITEFVKCAIGTICATLFIVIIDCYIDYGSPFIECVISTAVYFILYALVLLFAKEQLLWNIKNNVVDRVKGK